jgi:hypothetical protein
VDNNIELGDVGFSRVVTSLRIFYPTFQLFRQSNEELLFDRIGPTLKIDRVTQSCLSCSAAAASHSSFRSFLPQPLGASFVLCTYGNMGHFLYRFCSNITIATACTLASPNRYLKNACSSFKSSQKDCH